MVEFALIMPVLVIALFGAAEMAQAISSQRHVVRGTTILGSMIARESSMDRATLNSIFDAAEAIVEPLDMNDLRIVASGIAWDEAQGDYLVVWSHGRRRDPDRVGSIFTFDDARSPAGSFVVVVTVESKHRGNVTQFFVEEIKLFEQHQFLPRDSERIDLSNNSRAYHYAKSVEVLS